MLKSFEILPQTFFNYLGEGNSAIFSAVTGYYTDERLNSGIVWAQYDRDDRITAAAAVGESGRTLLFTDENADYDELSFLVNGSVISPDILPFGTAETQYLMLARSQYDRGEKGVDRNLYFDIKHLDTEDIAKATDGAAVKMYQNAKGLCQGAVIYENGRIIGGGFVSFGNDYSVISDVYVKEEYRGKGYGSDLVKKLLKLSSKENVYLICKEKNIGFYEKLGFTVVKELYNYI
ncbi:MAG: GNAT family N-acetyltransferase [Oscillospiraceae bacterium]|nr:GNAT family N-acetyltransferase [Oscillospiraceae bacterium]